MMNCQADDGVTGEGSSPSALQSDVCGDAGLKMKLSEHLAKLSNARTADELELTFREGFCLFKKPLTRKRIRKAVTARGNSLVSESQHAQRIPTIGKYRKMQLCGKTYSVGFGGNSTGERYCWFDARAWAKDTLMEAGVCDQLAESIIEWTWSGYPHRALQAIEKNTQQTPRQIEEAVGR